MQIVTLRLTVGFGTTLKMAEFENVRTEVAVHADVAINDEENPEDALAAAYDILSPKVQDLWTDQAQKQLDTYYAATATPAEE